MNEVAARTMVDQVHKSQVKCAMEAYRIHQKISELKLMDKAADVGQLIDLCSMIGKGGGDRESRLTPLQSFVAVEAQKVSKNSFEVFAIVSQVQAYAMLALGTLALILSGRGESDTTWNGASLN